MPEGMISPRQPDPIRLNRGSLNQADIVCPVCETNQFEHLDLAAGTGKCVSGHYVMRRAEGVWRCVEREAMPNPDQYGFESVRVMRLQPDDVIVVEVDYPVSLADQDLFKARLNRVFPGHKAIVLDNGARLSVARPDGDLGSVKPDLESEVDGPAGGIGCWKPVE